MPTECMRGLIDSRGNEVTACVYKSIEEFTEGLAKVVSQDGHYGIIDLQGVLKIPCIYKDCRI